MARTMVGVGHGVLDSTFPPSLGEIVDLVATASEESAVLTWTPAENATSHQPQYSLDGSTWVDFGTALGAAANTVTVTGLTADTLYTFRVIASDGTNETTSNTDTATPTASNGVEPFAYDNFDSGQHSQNGITWYTLNGFSLSTVNPYNGTHCLRCTYPGTGTDSNRELRASFNPRSEIWLSWRLFIPVNFHAGLGDGTVYDKFWIIGYGNNLHGGWGEPGGWTVRMEARRWNDDNNLWQSRLVYGNETSGASSSDANDTGPTVSNVGGVVTAADRGTWVEYGIHLKLATTIIASDGECHFYKNGSLILTNVGYPWGGVSFTTPADCFELMGWSNYGYSEDMTFDVDDVRIYDTDPGW